MKLRDTLSATLLSHADILAKRPLPVRLDPSNPYPLWLPVVRTLFWATFFTLQVGLVIRAVSGQWSLFMWPFWWIVSIGVVWGGMTVFAWNRRAARLHAAAAAGQPAPEAERLPVWSRFTLVPLYYLLFLIVTPLALVLTVANRMSAREWTDYRAELVARGVTLDLLAMVPKPVTDAENFAATPLFKDLGYTSDAIHSQAGQAALKRLEKITLPSLGQPNSPPWLTQKKVSLADYRAVLTNATVFSQSAANVSDATAVLAALKAWDAELREIETAATRSVVAFPVRYQDAFSALLPHLAHIRSLSSNFRLRASARLDASEAAGALQDFKTCWGLGKISASEPFMISYLVGVAIDGQAMQPIWEGLGTKAWNESQLAELESLLASRNYSKLCRRSLDAERAASTTIMEQWIADPAGMDKASSGLAEAGGGNGLMNIARILPVRFIMTENLISLNRWHDELIPKDGSVPDFRETDRKMDGLVASPWQPRYIFVRLLFPAFGNFLRKAAGAEVHQSLARTAIALERHQLAAGSYPDTLAALTPKFLPTALNDPFSKGPLHYSKTADGRYLLHSVGPNGRDDQGRFDKRAKSSEALRVSAPTTGRSGADDIAWTYLPLEK